MATRKERVTVELLDGLLRGTGAMCLSICCGEMSLVAEPLQPFLSSTDGLTTLIGLPSAYARIWSNTSENWISYSSLVT